MTNIIQSLKERIKEYYREHTKLVCEDDYIILLKEFLAYAEEKENAYNGGYEDGKKDAHKEFHTSKCPICANEKAEIKRQAQKEFLDFLIKYLNDETNGLCDCDVCIMIKDKIKELKKDVGK
jgi:hypothetical protein